MISFFFTAKEYSIVYMYNAFIIDSSVEGHLVCSHSLEKISKTFWLNKAYMTFFAYYQIQDMGSHLWQ